VNYYHMDSTLSGHTDNSEQNKEAPLFSFRWIYVITLVSVQRVLCVLLAVQLWIMFRCWNSFRDWYSFHWNFMIVCSNKPLPLLSQTLQLIIHCYALVWKYAVESVSL
jgi:hypothetical protein